MTPEPEALTPEERLVVAIAELAYVAPEMQPRRIAMIATNYADEVLAVTRQALERMVEASEQVAPVGVLTAAWTELIEALAAARSVLGEGTGQ